MHSHHDNENHVEFTSRGAWLGFFAYIILALIIVFLVIH
jgi:hypothetical protein